MANDLNKHQCIGRLGADPEIKYMPNGNAVATLSVACGSKWKDKQTGQMQERTEWIRYTAFGRLAEIMGEYLRKGSKVYLSGELRTRKWQSQDGQDRYTTEIVASDMQMLDSRDSGAPNQNQAPQRQQAAQQNQQPTSAPGYDDFDDESIPF